MRFSVAILMLFALACTAAPSFANSTADMAQMQKAFVSVKSYHAEMHMPQGRSMSIDYVAPNKYHETMFNGMQFVNIGTDMWMNQGGKWMKLPSMAAPGRSMMEQLRSAGLRGEAMKNYTITDLGPAMLGAVPAHHYRVVDKQDQKPTDLWVGMNHLPLQMKVSTPEGPMTILYSKYNAVADITPPM